MLEQTFYVRTMIRVDCNTDTGSDEKVIRTDAKGTAQRLDNFSSNIFCILGLMYIWKNEGEFITSQSCNSIPPGTDIPVPSDIT